MIKPQITAVALSIYWQFCSFAMELDSSELSKNKQIVPATTSLSSKDKTLQEEKEARHNVVLGSMGLLGFHKPGLKAIFRKDAIYCAEIAVFFNGLSRFYLPSYEFQLPFFEHFEKCAKENSVPSTDPRIKDFLKDDFNEFLLIEIKDRVEVILHYLAFLNRTKIKNHPRGTFYTGGVYGKELDHEKILTYFQPLLHQEYSTMHDCSEEKLLDVAQKYIAEKQEKEEFPLGAAIMTTLEYDSVFCSLRQYKWVHDVSNIFNAL